MPMSKSPPPPLTGAAVSIAGSTPALIIETMPPSELPHWPKGMSYPPTSTTPSPSKSPASSMPPSPSRSPVNSKGSASSPAGTCAGSQGRPSGQSGWPFQLRMIRTICIQSTTVCRNASRVWNMYALKKSPPLSSVASPLRSRARSTGAARPSGARQFAPSTASNKGSNESPSGMPWPCELMLTVATP